MKGYDPMKDKFTIISAICILSIASVCFAGMFDTIVLSDTSVTTSTTPTQVAGAINGIVRAIEVNVLTADANVDLDVYDWKSNLLYTADNVTAGSSTYYPVVPSSLRSGVVDTNLLKWIQPPNGGEITAYFGDADNATSSVSITILYEKE